MHTFHKQSLDQSIPGDRVAQLSQESLRSLVKLDFVFGYSTDIQRRHSLNLLILGLLDSGSGVYSEKYLTDLNRLRQIGFNGGTYVQPEEFRTGGIKAYASGIDHYYNDCYLEAADQMKIFRQYSSHPLLMEMSYLMQIRSLSRSFRDGVKSQALSQENGTFFVTSGCAYPKKASLYISRISEAFCELEQLTTRASAFADDFDYMRNVVERWADRNLPTISAGGEQTSLGEGSACDKD